MTPPSPRAVRNPLRRQLVAAPVPPGPVDFHRCLPGYAPTPLLDLPSLAEPLGVGRVLVKDESERLGLPAFKMLGASWATYRALVERLGHEPEPWADVTELAERFAPLRPLTLVTATDGNHGRAVARVARLLGLRARIRVPAGTAQARIDAIAGEGAGVTVSAGDYDEAVREVAAWAAPDVLVISDTSWPGYETVPAWVIDGYTTIFTEIDAQLADADQLALDAVVVPIGVGALAAAAVTHYRQAPDSAVVLVGVEPTTAACLLASAEAGHLVTVPGAGASVMAGLNCGTPSAVAWPRVAAGFDWFVTVDDAVAERAMALLAAAGVVAGESGAASLAGALELVAETGTEVLGPDATVLLLSTEGATDPEHYRRVVGRDAAEVAALRGAAGR